MFNYMKDSITFFLLDIYEVLWNYAKKISMLVNRVFVIFQKIFFVFEDILFTIAHTIYTVAAVWNSNIGGAARFFCFSKKTPIIMEDNTIKYISEIQIGDQIKNCGKVITTHIFTAKNTKMFLYKNKIKVSSDHIVYENNKWIRIYNSIHSKPIQNKEQYIYCINTTTGNINTPFGIFRDYMEISNNIDMKHILNIIMNQLNKQIITTIIVMVIKTGDFTKIL